MIGGNVFSIAFGRNLDAHAPTEPAEPTSNGTAALSAIYPTLANATRALVAARAGGSVESDASHQCLQGRTCYVDSLVLTTAACTLALVLSVYAGWRDYRSEKRRSAILNRERHAPVPQVVWDAEE